MSSKPHHGKDVGTIRHFFHFLILCTVFTLITMNLLCNMGSFATRNTVLQRLFSMIQKQSQISINTNYFEFRHSSFFSNLQEKKTILLWYIPFHDMTMALEFGQDAIENARGGIYRMNSTSCGNCVITYDRSKLSSSDAVVFHAPQTVTSDLPAAETRRPDQLFVWWIQESSGRYHFSSGSGKMTNFFNQTMTVRRSSDIYSPYSSLSNILKMLWNKQKGNDFMKKFAIHRKVSLSSDDYLQNALNNLPARSLTTTFSEIPTTVLLDIHPLLKKKNRKAAWIVSNCGSRKRFNYYNKLTAAGLKSDLFGSCGQAFPIKSRWDPAFYEVLSRYKFYLAFENSYHCEDYFTEKLWYNSLYSGAVPIIFGPHKDDVAAVLPQKSYIHTEEYKTVQDLVNYLHYLDQNVTAYSEYLEWRSWIKYLDENGEFHPQNIQNKAIDNLDISDQTLQLLNNFAAKLPTGFCSLCKTIHKSNQLTNMIPHVGEWFSQDRRKCEKG